MINGSQVLHLGQWTPDHLFGDVDGRKENKRLLTSSRLLRRSSTIRQEDQDPMTVPSWIMNNADSDYETFPAAQSKRAARPRPKWLSHMEPAQPPVDDDYETKNARRATILRHLAKRKRRSKNSLTRQRTRRTPQLLEIVWPVPGNHPSQTHLSQMMRRRSSSGPRCCPFPI